MLRLVELRVAVGTVERAQQTVDAVTRMAVHTPHAPLGQALQDELAGKPDDSHSFGHP
jgi:hypothetical protein